MTSAAPLAAECGAAAHAESSAARQVASQKAVLHGLWCTTEAAVKAAEALALQQSEEIGTTITMLMGLLQYLSELEAMKCAARPHRRQSFPPPLPHRPPLRLSRAPRPGPFACLIQRCSLGVSSQGAGAGRMGWGRA